MPALDELTANGFEPDEAISILAETGDVLAVELPQPIEYLTECLGLEPDAAVDLLCNAEAAVRTAYYTQDGRWLFPTRSNPDETPPAAEFLLDVLNQLGVELREQVEDPAQLLQVLDEVGDELNDDILLENAFRSHAQRKWFFANLGKKGGPAGGKGGKGGAGAKDGKGAAGAKSGAAVIAKEPTTAPPPGKFYSPDPTADGNKDGVADAARVGVPAHEVPPPPKIPRLPNLTKAERAEEKKFADAYEKDPDGMARTYLEKIAKSSDPPKFETDAAKGLSATWNHEDIGTRAQNRAQYNTALHQTANAVTKRAFQQHLDTLKEGDEILVTVGGCGAGKGYALKNVPEALEVAKRSKAIWDSAGDQNATENTWLLEEAKKRGLKLNMVYVHADPKTQWADPERGVVKRASSPDDGRMVDASVFADSYALGAKNMRAFVEKHGKDPDVNFTYLDNRGKPKLMDGLPKDAEVNRDELHRFAMDTIAERSEIPAHIKRGATIGARIWGE